MFYSANSLQGIESRSILSTKNPIGEKDDALNDDDNLNPKTDHP